MSDMNVGIYQINCDYDLSVIYSSGKIELYSLINIVVKDVFNLDLWGLILLRDNVKWTCYFNSFEIIKHKSDYLTRGKEMCIVSVVGLTRIK